MFRIPTKGSFGHINALLSLATTGNYCQMCINVEVEITVWVIGILTSLSMEVIKFVIAFHTVQFINGSTSVFRLIHTHTHKHTLRPWAIKSLLELVHSDSSYQKAVKWELV